MRARNQARLSLERRGTADVAAPQGSAEAALSGDLQTTLGNEELAKALHPDATGYRAFTGAAIGAAMAGVDPREWLASNGLVVRSVAPAGPSAAGGLPEAARSPMSTMFPRGLDSGTDLEDGAFETTPDELSRLASALGADDFMNGLR